MGCGGYAPSPVSILRALLFAIGRGRSSTAGIRTCSRVGDLTTDEPYGQDSLAPVEREEFEADLISFCDRELDLLGDVGGQHVLYAGGAALLWLEGLGDRIGPNGTLTALESDPRRVQEARDALPDMDIAAPVRLVAGSVFEPPFEPGAFDLVYSAGLFHELDVRERPVEAVLSALADTLKSGGRLATSDFVDTVDAVQLEDEALDRELARVSTGAELFGIHGPETLARAHEAVLDGVRWRVLPPVKIRHLDKVVLADAEAPVPDGLRGRRNALVERVRREGYTRPATVFVEGWAFRP